MPNTTIASYITNSLLPNACEASQNKNSVFQHVKNLLALHRESNCKDKYKLFSNKDLELVFGASIAVGFTLWQILASIERLSQSKSWQNHNPELWKTITENKKLVGLGTTHLAAASGAKINGELIDANTYKIHGELPWLTGVGLIDSLVIGFKTNADEIIFALTDINKDIQLRPYVLSALDSTSTYAGKITNLEIKPQQIISQVKPLTPNLPRASIYRFPEIGIAKMVSSTIHTNLEKSNHPKNITIQKKVAELDERLNNFAQYQYGNLTDNMFFAEAYLEKDNLIRSYVRLLIFSEGSRAILKDSLASRLNSEIILLDIVIQPANVIEQKIQALK